jgi:hypothetical protein
MTVFDDRRAGFEAAYKRDQELAFRIAARRNRLFGLWAAGQLGLTGEEAEAYARTVVAADLAEPGDDDVIAWVQTDMASKGVGIGETELRAALTRAAIAARRQLTDA